MAKGQTGQQAEILQYALSHLEAERDKIQAKIDEIRRELGTSKGKPGRKSAASMAMVSTATAPAATAPAAPGRKKRVLSESARKRIAAAQKKRWAEHRKKQRPVR